MYLRTFDFEKISIVEVVNEIILDAIKKKASDIHFDPIEECLMVRIRIDGELQDYTKIPNIIKKNVITRIKIISGMNITETRMPQDGASKNMIEQTALDLRVSSLPCFMGEKIILNNRLKTWLFDIVEDMIESTIEDNPDRVSTIIAVNNFIEQLNLYPQELEMTEIIGEKIANKIFDEIKSNI